MRTICTQKIVQSIHCMQRADFAYNDVIKILLVLHAQATLRMLKASLLLWARYRYGVSGIADGVLTVMKALRAMNDFDAH